MALSYKDPETDALVEQVAHLTGESPADALKTSLRQRLERERKAGELNAKIDAIVARVKALPVLDDRSADEILGYDENGLPT